MQDGCSKPCQCCKPMYDIFLFSLKAFVTIYVLILIFLYLNQDSIVFATQPLSQNIRLQDGTSEMVFSHQSETLHGWFIHRKKAPLLIYYGGNGEEVSSYMPLFEQQQKYSVLMLNYRGYGKSTGNPSEISLVADALFVFDAIINQRKLIPQQEVFLMGRSLGSGIAVQVAAQRPVVAIILVTPYDTLTNVGARKYPMLPVKWMIRHRFDSLSHAPNIKTPALFLSAELDTLIPPEHAFSLEEAWAGVSQRHVFAGASHDDITQQALFWPMVENYILKQGSETQVQSENKKNNPSARLTDS
ncbi:MAG: alpha/beta fold hydrolase [Mariprofundaceae bacterium]|nr:alpha/beta fold hydrolase [Mariprofundaceae bacterium]